MADYKPIKRALISVFHKEGLDEILALLDRYGVELISTGGSRDYIAAKGYACRAVEDLTGYPSILGGRVKTLHPQVMGGILARRDRDDDAAEQAKWDIPSIDLVIVDLYPFVDTVRSGASTQEIVEKIDIGGITLIRAAAKNYADVLIVGSSEQYAPLRELLEQQGAETSLEQRRRFARMAFGVSSAYDCAIFNYFDGDNGDLPSALRVAEDHPRSLRYGENPHQQGALYGGGGVFTQLHGKDISYCNLLDINAALELISEFEGADSTTTAILKHNNACGIATRPTALEAWKRALEGDPVSAFGGVIVTSSAVTKEVADEINKIFFEVIMAPDFTEDALDVLRSKKNRIILKLSPDATRSLGHLTMRSVLGGVLVQERDTHVATAADLRVVTKKAPTAAETADLLFANKIVKHCKSNAIVLAKDGMLLASGVGQTSRVDSLRQAIEKARGFGFDLHGAVMASDAFFPFADCVEIAHQAGIEAVIHPGGSIRDAESVVYCDANGMAMVMTGVRHFRH